MKELSKAVEEYNEWKCQIHNVLITNFTEISNLLIDIYGSRTFIPFNKTPSSGVAVNIDPATGEHLLWFLENGNFHLIQRNEEFYLLNISPSIINNQNLPSNPGIFKANKAKEINFILNLLEESEEIIKVINHKIQKTTPAKSSESIKELIASSNQ